MMITYGSTDGAELHQLKGKNHFLLSAFVDSKKRIERVVDSGYMQLHSLSCYLQYVGLPNIIEMKWNAMMMKGGGGRSRETDKNRKKETRFLQSTRYLFAVVVVVFCKGDGVLLQQQCSAIAAWGPKQKLTIIKCKYRNSAATSVGQKIKWAKELFRLLTASNSLASRASGCR